MLGEAILCDLDGTIADTRSANEAAYTAAFGAVGLQFPADAYQRSFGLNFADMMKVIAPEVDATTAARIAMEKQRAYPEHFHLAKVNSPLLVILRRLRAAGQAIALATTARRANVLSLLTALEMNDLFDVIVTAEDVDSGKPAPDAYLLAAKLLGADPRDCVVFEDSAPGIAAAEAAGCSVVKVAL